MSVLQRLLSYSVQAPGNGVWLPRPASTEAAKVDSLFHVLLYGSIVFFVLLVGLALLFAIAYRRRSPEQKTSPVAGSRALVVAAAVIPAVFLMVIFVWGARDYLSMSVAPEDAIEVRVTGQRWSWAFDYPKDGINAKELVVPVDRPVKLLMASTDVAHSFYVPAFRLKRDVLPNRQTSAWFEAEEKGEYKALCSEYCGSKHSSMIATIKVVSERDYQEWIDSGGGLGGEGVSPAEFGAKMFKAKGCTACHSVDGTKLVGPTLKDKYGFLEKLADGTEVKVDDDYIRESITKPNAKVVHGFQPVMPSYDGQLKDKQLNAIVAYIQSVSSKGSDAAKGEEAEPEPRGKAEPKGEEAEPEPKGKAEPEPKGKAEPKAKATPQP